MTAGRSGALLGAVCLFSLSPARASARPSELRVTLEYRPASQCPAVEALKPIVIARLGYDPFADDARHHVSLSITPNGRSLDGRIEWRDAEGHWAGDQSFSMGSGDCLQLARTMALALAVQIQLLGDPNATPAPPADPQPDSSPPARPAQDASTPSPPLAPTPARGRAPEPRDVTSAPSKAPRLMLAVGAGPSIGFGWAPQPLALGRVFGVLAARTTSIELAAEASLPATARREDGAGISVGLLLIGLAGCEAVGRFRACLVANAGVVSMAGEGIDRPTSSRSPFANTGVRAGFSQPLGDRAFVSARGDGLVVLTRWTASLDDVPVWTMPRFAAALGIDVGLQLR